MEKDKRQGNEERQKQALIDVLRIPGVSIAKVETRTGNGPVRKVLTITVEIKQTLLIPHLHRKTSERLGALEQTMAEQADKGERTPISTGSAVVAKEKRT